MQFAAMLMALVAAHNTQTAMSSFEQTLHAWRAAPGACTVTTQVIVREGEREGVSSAEPCVLAWDVSRSRILFRRGGFTVQFQEQRVQAAHEQGDAAVDRQIGADADVLTAWRDCFAEMPWPQAGLALAPEKDLLRLMDAEVGELTLKNVEVDPDGGMVATLEGAHGGWKLKFRGDTVPRLVEAERTLSSGPRVPANGRITWSMHFEPIDIESSLWKLPIESRRRVDRVEDVMPATAKKRAPIDGDTITPTP